MNKAFHVKIVAKLIRQAIDTCDFVLEDQLYQWLIKSLERKGKGVRYLDIAWGTGDVLQIVAPLWAGRMCTTIREPNPAISRDDQSYVASSVAAMLLGIRHPDLAPALIWGVTYYQRRRRLIEALGTSGDPRAVDYLLHFLDDLLTKRDDPEIIADVARALGELGDLRARLVLEKITQSEEVPTDARRAAYKALYRIFGEPQYQLEIPYSEGELVARLGVRDLMLDGKEIYSD